MCKYFSSSSQAHANAFANEIARINKNVQVSEKNGFDAELGICAAIPVSGRNSIIND